jgi:hypothetical protein
MLCRSPVLETGTGNAFEENEMDICFKAFQGETNAGALEATTVPASRPASTTGMTPRQQQLLAGDLCAVMSWHLLAIAIGRLVAAGGSDFDAAA